MNRTAIRSWALTPAALLAALLAQGWCAPAARATCGDYLAHPGDGPHARRDTPRHSSGGHGMPGRQTPGAEPSRPSDEGDAPEAPPCRRCPHEPAGPGRAPCQGPWCSDDHGPLPAPPTTVERAQDHWACWWSVLRAGEPDFMGLAFLRGQSARVHHVFPVYHPPRAA